MVRITRIALEMGALDTCGPEHPLVFLAERQKARVG